MSFKDLYGEPFGHGWGIDLPGIGASVKFKSVQAHTLKPNHVPHTDGHMVLENGRIVFQGDGQGRCLTARNVSEGSLLDAEPCEESNERQVWSCQVIVFP